MPTPVTTEHVLRTEELLAILGREHAALLAGDLEAIEAIIPAKQAAIARLESLTRGIALDAADDEHGRRLLALAAACRHQNDVNGGMVEASLRHAQRVLALLRGQNPEQDLYSRGGTTLPGAGTRPLAKA